MSNDILENNLKNVKLSEKIDLIILSACHSEEIANIFLKYVANNVIYIDKLCKINEIVIRKFLEYFFHNLIHK